MSKNKSYKSYLTGIVLSNKMKNTVIVNIDTIIKHKLYKKYLFKKKKIHAHFNEGEYSIGQKVFIKKSRPISKMKSWIVVNVSDKNI